MKSFTVASALPLFALASAGYHTQVTDVQVTVTCTDPAPSTVIQTVTVTEYDNCGPGGYPTTGYPYPPTTVTTVISNPSGTLYPPITVTYTIPPSGYPSSATSYPSHTDTWTSHSSYPSSSMTPNPPYPTTSTKTYPPYPTGSNSTTRGYPTGTGSGYPSSPSSSMSIPLSTGYPTTATGYPVTPIAYPTKGFKITGRREAAAWFA